MADDDGALNAFLTGLGQGSISFNNPALNSLASSLAANMESNMEGIEEEQQQQPVDSSLADSGAKKEESDEELGSADDLDDDDLDVDLDDLEPIPSGFQPSTLFSPMGDLGGGMPGLSGLQASMMRELLKDSEPETMGRASRLSSKSGAAHLPSSEDNDMPLMSKSNRLVDSRASSIAGALLDDVNTRHPLGRSTQMAEVAEEGEEDEEEEEEVPDAEAIEQAQDATSKEELRMLMSVFSEDQLQRYEVYRRSALSKSAVRKLVASILQQTISPTMAFVVAGFTKVFVGEIVEIARDVMEEAGQAGSLRPEHLREALRRYKSVRGTPPCAIYRRRPPANF
ncbi:hTAFII28-like protein conserved region-domain-containing protein [Syncephalis fuscata]|nr:hTAFII28-like protein conserved region-domain-containing protein [Syncephalis fuscata]